MLAWINHTASYARSAHGARVVIKVHISHGQVCPDYKNEKGEPLNFNFLPQFAVPELAVAPHTVQTYAFDDPAAGTYGNTNFSFMLDWACGGGFILLFSHRMQCQCPQTGVQVVKRRFCWISCRPSGGCA